MTRYGTQPAYILLVERRLSISAAARRMDVPRRSLHNVLFGCTRPNPAIVVALVELLGAQPAKLFTAEALAAPNRQAQPLGRKYDGYVLKRDRQPEH